MHMADALVSPVVGGAMWAASVGVAAYSARKLERESADHTVPLMGVLGAFVFAAQMINFTIPLTGSSGHLGGGLMLAILLGPHAAFLVMFSILSAQALFFADGGLLALGCNVFNLGFWPCFVAYPLIYRRIVGARAGRGRVLAGAMTAAIFGLQAGAASVVLETLVSGISALKFGSFIMLMLPIHLAIGIVEGLATATVVSFVRDVRPELALPEAAAAGGHRRSLKTTVVAFGVATVLVGGVLSWFASTHPDGLEWAMLGVTGSEELASPEGGAHGSLQTLQDKTAFMPDYGFASDAAHQTHEGGEKVVAGEHTDRIADGDDAEATAGGESWPSVSAGTSVAGLVGGAIVFALSGLVGLSMHFIRRRG